MGLPIRQLLKINNIVVEVGMPKCLIFLLQLLCILITLENMLATMFYKTVVKMFKHVYWCDARVKEIRGHLKVREI